MTRVPPPPRTIFLLSLEVAALLLASGAASAMGPGISEYLCGPLKPPGQYGPFDYRTVPYEDRHRVEDYHFTPKVEAAIDGATGAYGGDIDYTLRAFPNSPRALLSISRYSLQHHNEHLSGARYATECYFERAMRYQPNDAMVHVIYAIYLKDRKRMAEVRPQLDEAERIRGDQSSFDFDYNLGLLYFDVGAYDQAMTAARRAYALGAPLPALQRKLQAAGKWKNDPAPAPAPSSTEPATPPAADAGPAAGDSKGEIRPDPAEPPATR